MISEIAYFKLTDGLERRALGALWRATNDPIFYEFPKQYAKTYQGRIDLFFIILKRLIEENKLCLAKKGEFLKGSIDEQLEMFRNSFPNEERMKVEDAYWWFLGECPAGVVWIIDEEVEGYTTPAYNGKHYYWA